MAAKTLYDKLWDAHVVRENDDGTSLIYIDRHLVHEVTSPQAFEGLKLAGRPLWRVDANVATADHNVPTTDRAHGIADPVSRLQVETLDENCRDYGIVEYGMNDANQGIVHVIGPELGATLPGMTVVCGDSHTSTHGAFGALAFGIGTSEVEHVLATQCLIMKKAKNMRVQVDGAIPAGVTAKDIVLAIIGRIGTAGGTGHAIEFAGSAIEALSVEGRMTLCNMAIEAGARAGMVAVDDKTIEFDLRQGVKFHNGEEFDADSVVYTLNFVAEIGDKSQIAVIVLVASTAAPVSVFAGAGLALTIIAVSSVVIGTGLARVLEARWIRLASTVLFIAAGVVLILEAVLGM